MQYQHLPTFGGHVWALCIWLPVSYTIYHPYIIYLNIWLDPEVTCPATSNLIAIVLFHEGFHSFSGDIHAMSTSDPGGEVTQGPSKRCCWHPTSFSCLTHQVFHRFQVCLFRSHMFFRKLLQNLSFGVASLMWQGTLTTTVDGYRSCFACPVASHFLSQPIGPRLWLQNHLERCLRGETASIVVVVIINIS